MSGPGKRVAQMTPEERERKRLRDQQRDAWRPAHRLYLKLLRQREVLK